MELVMENLISSDTDPVQALRIDRTAFAKKQAHNQIHAFMDCYQKDMIGRLAPKSMAYGQPQEIKPIPSQAENDNGGTLKETTAHPKSDRERLHKIWLAMKPVFKPSTAF
jgi:hypothetical protein